MLEHEVHKFLSDLSQVRHFSWQGRHSPFSKYVPKGQWVHFPVVLQNRQEESQFLVQLLSESSHVAHSLLLHSNKKKL